MLKITNKIQKLWSLFADKEYRSEFVGDSIADGLSVQIYNMREARGWTQQELADFTDTGQSAICRWENSEPPASINTLRKIADAFDVALVVKFIPFSEFVSDRKEPIDREIPSFVDDGLRMSSSTIWYMKMTEDETRDVRVANDDIEQISISSYVDKSYQEYIN